MDSTAYEALRNSAAWIDYTLRGKIRVSGEDAGRLLHAMTTNHIQGLAAGAGIYAFFLNDKGRILADATIFRLNNSFWLDTEPEVAAKIHHLLDKYIIADDAAAEDETQRWFCVGVEGPESTAAMERLGLAVPEASLAILEQDWGYIARVASTGAVGFRVWADETKRAPLYEALSTSGLPQAMEGEQRTVRIENGLPRYGEDISERYLVQETRLLHAVHSNKGCYLGQEIVERVRSRGQVHRLLTALRIDGSLDLAAGVKLVADNAPAGEITSSAFSPAFNQTVALGYVRTEIVESRSPVFVAGTEPAVTARILG